MSVDAEQRVESFYCNSLCCVVSTLMARFISASVFLHFIVSKSSLCSMGHREAGEGQPSTLFPPQACLLSHSILTDAVVMVLGDIVVC